MVESEGQRQEQPFTYLQFGSHRLEPPFQFAYVLAEQCDTVVTGAHPLFHCFKTVNRIASTKTDPEPSACHSESGAFCLRSQWRLAEIWAGLSPSAPTEPHRERESSSAVFFHSHSEACWLRADTAATHRPRYRPTRLSCSRYGPGSPKRPLSPISSGGHSFWPVHILQMCDVVMKCDVKKSQN